MKKQIEFAFYLVVLWWTAYFSIYCMTTMAGHKQVEIISLWAFVAAGAGAILILFATDNKNGHPR